MPLKGKRSIGEKEVSVRGRLVQQALMTTMRNAGRMRGRRNVKVLLGASSLLMLLSLGGLHAQTELFRNSANIENGRRLGTFHDWIQEILEHVAALISNLGTPKLRGSADEDYDSHIESDTTSSGPHNPTSGSSSKGKGVSKKSKASKRSSSSEKKKGRSKKSKSKKSNFPTPSSSPAPSPTETPVPTPVVVKTPTSTPKEPETGPPLSSPSSTFAPFITVEPSAAPFPMPLTFAPFTTLAPAIAPVNSNSTAAPTDSFINTTVAPTTSSPPTSAPVLSSTAPAPTLQRVTIPPYYIVYAATAADREPTQEEYLLMNDLTIQYFEEVFGNLYNSSDPEFGGVSLTVFNSVESEIDDTQYNAGIPEEKYNIYMSFNTDIIFSTLSTVIPTVDELFDIMVEAINPTYIVNYVWQAPETPFISTQEVLMEAVQVLEIVESPDDATTFGIGDIEDDTSYKTEHPVQVLEIIETTSDAATFGQGDVPGKEELQAENEAGALGQSATGRTSTLSDLSSFGQGSATDRDFLSPSRFILPGSIIKDTIFRPEDNGTR